MHLGCGCRSFVSVSEYLGRRYVPDNGVNGGEGYGGNTEPSGGYVVRDGFPISSYDINRTQENNAASLKKIPCHSAHCQDDIALPDDQGQAQ